MVRIEDSVMDARDSAKAYIASEVDLDWEELDPIMEYVWTKFSSDEREILWAYEALVGEFAKGHRCIVCGNTQAQSDAIGYNCTEEC